MDIKVSNKLKKKGVQGAGVMKAKGRPPMDKKLALVVSERMSVTEDESIALVEVAHKIGFNSVSELIRYCVTFTLASHEGKKVQKFTQITTLSESWSWQRASADILRVVRENKQTSLPLELIGE